MALKAIKNLLQKVIKCMLPHVERLPEDFLKEHKKNRRFRKFVSGIHLVTASRIHNYGEAMMGRFFSATAVVFMLILGVTSGYAATIQYIGSGKKDAPAEISFSRNNGATWQKAKVVPGQTFAVPSDATHLNINNAPRDPKKNYKIREGNVF